MPSFRELLATTTQAIREVDTAEADELRSRPGAVVLDVREPDEFEQGALPGALHIARGNLESNVESRITDHSAPVVIYCGGGNCEDSHMLAEKLYMVGFDNVLIYKDGFPDWEKRRLAVTRGTNP